MIKSIDLLGQDTKQPRQRRIISIFPHKAPTTAGAAAAAHCFIF